MTGIHITSDEVFNQTIETLNPNTEYEIINKKSIKTKYGERFILVDSDNKSYWAPGSIVKALTNHPKLTQFHLQTKDYDTWTTKEGEERKVLKFEIFA